MELRSTQNLHQLICDTRTVTSERSTGLSGERRRSSAPYKSATVRNKSGERAHSRAGFRTCLYLRFWFQKNGRRYHGYSEIGLSVTLNALCLD
jgi:hypothetical protein